MKFKEPTSEEPSPIPSDFYKGMYVMVKIPANDLAEVKKLGVSTFKTVTTSQQKVLAEPYIIGHTAPVGLNIASSLNTMNMAQREKILTTLRTGSLPFSTLEDLSSNSTDFVQNHLGSNAVPQRLEGQRLLGVLKKNLVQIQATAIE